MGDRAEMVCSLCVLYESPWGCANEKGVAAFVTAVEAERGAMFDRAPDTARLLNPADADRIVAALALSCRVFAAQDVRKAPIPA